MLVAALFFRSCLQFETNTLQQDSPPSLTIQTICKIICKVKVFLDFCYPFGTIQLRRNSSLTAGAQLPLFFFATAGSAHSCPEQPKTCLLESSIYELQIS